MFHKRAAAGIYLIVEGKYWTGTRKLMDVVCIQRYKHGSRHNRRKTNGTAKKEKTITGTKKK